jgi:NADPH:quinone reductase-like Zn-dependent oxidoreductase
MTTVPVPGIAPDEVLVEVHAAGVDRGVSHLMTGIPYAVRLSGFGLIRPKTPVPGLDLSGRVVAVGADVSRFRVGDRVFGIGRGAYAEYALAKESKPGSYPSR